MECQGEVSIYAAVDVSGSMVGSKCSEVCSALQRIINDCPNDVLFDITLFSTTAWKAATALKTAINVDKLIEEIVTASGRKGMTAMYDAWGDMMSAIPAKVLKSGIVQIFILTDGEDNASEKYTHDSVMKLTQNIIRGNQAKFNFVQVGATGNAKVLSSLSSITGAKNQIQSIVVDDSAKGIRTAMNSVHDDIMSSTRGSKDKNKQLNSNVSTMHQGNFASNPISTAPVDLFSTNRASSSTRKPTDTSDNNKLHSDLTQNASANDLLSTRRMVSGSRTTQKNKDSNQQDSKPLDSNKLNNFNVLSDSNSTFCLK